MKLVNPITLIPEAYKFIVSLVVSVLTIGLVGYFLWDWAGDIREESVRNEFAKLSIQATEAQLTQDTVATEQLVKTVKVVEVKYVDKIKEITKYVETPIAQENAVKCTLTPGFISVYNSGGDTD